MTLSLSQVSTIPFLSSLESLSRILSKAQAHISSNSIQESTLISSRLITDMCDLAFQVQRLCDMATCLAVFVAKTEPLRMEENPTTITQMQERIAGTIAVLRALDSKLVDDKEDKEVVMALPMGERKYSTGANYVLTFLVPNFYFHYCTAYALLRKEGVSIGKGDYLGMA